MSGFRRILGLRDLVFYGVILITPIAPVGVFGVASKISQGHVSTTIVIAMMAMMLTAFSYGRMAAIYPSSGSAYAYVGRALNPHLGFLTGWVMFLDYLIIPILNTIYVSLTFERLAPQVPYLVWAALVAGSVTVLNLVGIRATARANSILLAAMSVVIAAFLVLGGLYLVRGGGSGALFSLQPFYNPATFHAHSVWTATSLAALTYIGFDGVTTLAEEARNPNATSCARWCWSVSSSGSSARSKSTSRNWSGPIIEVSRTRKPRFWMSPGAWEARCFSRPWQPF